MKNSLTSYHIKGYFCEPINYLSHFDELPIIIQNLGYLCHCYQLSLKTPWPKVTPVVRKNTSLNNIISPLSRLNIHLVRITFYLVRITFHTDPDSEKYYKMSPDTLIYWSGLRKNLQNESGHPDILIRTQKKTVKWVRTP